MEPLNVSGYKVVFVPFKGGKPAGEPEDFLTGFIKDINNAEVYGRPVGITVLADGSMLVADDASNVIWRGGSKKVKLFGNHPFNDDFSSS
jgi:glucose/arabinose dehydrogenase